MISELDRGICGILGTGGLIIKFRACTPARVHAFHVIPTRIECAFLVRGIAGYNQETFKLDRYQRMEFGEDPLWEVRTPTRSGADPDDRVEEYEQRCRGLSLDQEDAQTRRYASLCNPRLAIAGNRHGRGAVWGLRRGHPPRP